ncbi:MAG: hypothetical protein DRJ01_10060 [Bacteroidetes bacterium]|nr:MAG: hypothetical protein DRJ01_10060 [Bacteroidota bacterium]
MKKIFTILSAVLLTASVFLPQQAGAQTPEKMSYQAVVRDASDKLVTNINVGMQISILQGSETGTAVYVETQTPTTNANGLVSIEIGGTNATVVSGDFSIIDWATGLYFVKTEIDPTGGTNYTITGTSQLLSVPYALHAKTAEGITGGITETDPVFTNWDKDYTDLINTPITITTVQTDAITANTAKVGYTEALVSANADVVANTAKVGYTEALVSANADVVANTAKIGLTPGTTAGEMQYWNGTAWIVIAASTNEGATLTTVGGVPTWVPPTVTNPTTGKIWMDRNLGATQVATSSTDAAAYGDLYQWGRGTDGHQIRTSATTSSLSSNDDPGHGNFILAPNSPYDWRSPQNDNLWQGVSGVNNPCPTGYRIPTEAELDAERASWSSNDAAGAYASPLKLPVAGLRDSSNGSLNVVGSGGFYWSSTINGTSSYSLRFGSGNAYMGSDRRAYGFSVRCIKD